MQQVNAFLIGAQKAGTTSLFDWLVQHPDISAPLSMKDYHFFSNDRLYAQGIPFFEEQYESFQGSSILINGAVNNIYFSATSAPRIHNYNSEAKIIAILRNPIERAFSAYLYFRNNQEEESETFEQAIEKERTSNYKLHEEMGRFNYIDHGFYAKQLKEYYQSFPEEQIKVLIFEEVMAAKEQTMAALYEFLDVANDFVPNFKKINSTGQTNLKVINRLLYRNSKTKKLIKSLFQIDRWMSLELKTKIGFALRKLNTRNSKENTRVEALPEQIRKELEEVYRSDVEELSKLLNKDLHKLWNI